MRAGRLLVLSVVCSFVGLVTPAAAQTTTRSIAQDAAEALRYDAVYVHPDADFDRSDADKLRARISDADAGPIYIAILPEDAALETGGDEGQLLRAIGTELQRSGTYAVVVGDELRAGATGTGTPFDEGVVPAVANEAVRASGGEGAAAVLLDFVDGLAEEASGGGGDAASSLSLLPVLLVIALAVGAFVVVRGRRRRQREEQELEEVREVAMDDLVALGDDLRALDLDVEMPGADPRAKQDYVRALESYERATAGLDRARRPEDLREVTEALEQGRFAMASAKARLEGREPPERRSPCFFDPRHGPSVRDVEWAPPGGAPRAVPACASDADRVEHGEDPLVREITVAGRRRPYYDAPAYYGPWAGGYFGGFGLFEGMLLGSILSGGWGGWGWGAGAGGWGSDAGDGGAGGFGGGDFGGGGFGGGDFGGGGFGGGDFGGGDFGG